MSHYLRPLANTRQKINICRWMCSADEQFYKHRMKQINELSKEHQIYPHKLAVTHTLEEFIKSFSHLQNLSESPNKVSVAGRVNTIRKSSKKLRFFDIFQNSFKIQVSSNFSKYENSNSFFTDHDFISRGDIIWVRGKPIRTLSGELSVQSNQVKVLSPCLHLLPTTTDFIKDYDLIYRKRYLDLLYNESSRQKFIVRSKIVSFIRRYLENLGFIEVQTPILSSDVGGANAKPFITRHNALERNLFLRIAPELYLKNLVIGGFEKVFEIGQQFRNEGIDASHNPEFTACEFYLTHADYKDLILMTEELLSTMVLSIFNSFSISGNFNKKSIDLNFQPPFRKLDFMKTLEDRLQVTFPSPDKLGLEESRALLYSLCKKLKLNISPATQSDKLLDKLSSHVIHKTCDQPTFIVNYPEILSPLAKSHPDILGLTERFELFIAGHEVINAYSELNDPFEQRKRLENSNDSVDNKYILALEHGLPPTAGWGLGIDRLAMVLTGSDNIRNVILFPMIRCVDDDN